MFGKTGVAQVLYLSCYDLVALEWIDGGGNVGGRSSEPSTACEWHVCPDSLGQGSKKITS